MAGQPFSLAALAVTSDNPYIAKYYYGSYGFPKVRPDSIYPLSFPNGDENATPTSVSEHVHPQLVIHITGTERADPNQQVMVTLNQIPTASGVIDLTTLNPDSYFPQPYGRAPLSGSISVSGQREGRHVNYSNVNYFEPNQQANPALNGTVTITEFRPYVSAAQPGRIKGTFSATMYGVFSLTNTQLPAERLEGSFDVPIVNAPRPAPVLQLPPYYPITLPVSVGRASCVTHRGFRFLCKLLADAVHAYALQFPRPEWMMAFDTVPADAAATRKILFARAAKERLKVHTYYLPFPGVGHVRAVGAGYEWVPQPWAV